MKALCVSYAVPVQFFCCSLFICRLKFGYIMPPFVWLYSPMKVPLAFAYSCLLILEELLYSDISNLFFRRNHVLIVWGYLMGFLFLPFH